MLHSASALKYTRAVNCLVKHRHRDLRRVFANSASDAANNRKNKHILLLPWFGAREKDVTKCETSRSAMSPGRMVQSLR